MGNDLSFAFGQRLRVLRVHRGWSQEKLAERAGLHPNAIGMIERAERSPTLPNVGRIATGLGLTLEELFSGVLYDSKKKTWSYRVTPTKGRSS